MILYKIFNTMLLFDMSMINNRPHLAIKITYSVSFKERIVLDTLIRIIKNQKRK